MIKVNLLSAARDVRVRRPWLPPEQRAAAAGLGLLVVTALGLGGWWWSLHRESQALDVAIAAAQTQLAHVQVEAALVTRATARKAELQERVGLVNRLRREQRDPVDLLQEVSESLPDGLWLLSLRQKDGAVEIEGRAQTLTAVSDFAERLQDSDRFQRPVEILSTAMETMPDAQVVRFAVRGVLAAGAAAPPPAPGRPGVH